MIEIKKVSTVEDYKIVQHIAAETWPVTYGSILSKEQIDYMFGKMYAIEALEEQGTSKGHHFILAQEDTHFLGFASYELDYQNAGKTKIHKAYILPSAQGKGIGRILFSEIEAIAKQNNNNIISLNVNRFNSAINFYDKIGFIKVAEEDIEIGNGYLMEDFVLEKEI